MVVGRIDVPEHRDRDAPGGHVLDELLPLLGRGQRGRRHGLVGNHRRAHGSEHVVKDVAGGVRLGRGGRTRQDQRARAGRAEILDQGFELPGKRFGLGQAFESEGLEGRGIHALG